MGFFKKKEKEVEEEIDEISVSVKLEILTPNDKKEFEPGERAIMRCRQNSRIFKMLY